LPLEAAMTESTEYFFVFFFIVTYPSRQPTLLASWPCILGHRYLSQSSVHQIYMVNFTIKLASVE